MLHCINHCQVWAILFPILNTHSNIIMSRWLAFLLGLGPKVNKIGLVHDIVKIVIMNSRLQQVKVPSRGAGQMVGSGGQRKWVATNIYHRPNQFYIQMGKFKYNAVSLWPQKLVTIIFQKGGRLGKKLSLSKSLYKGLWPNCGNLKIKLRITLN